MNKKLNIGDYVRTKNGIIGKIMNMKLGYSTTTFGHSYIVLDSYTEDIDFNDIIKSSSNIIDLIEVGDYVNGVEVVGFDGGYVVINETNPSTELWKTLERKDIKTIVTKEQFESMEYKIGGEIN